MSLVSDIIFAPLETNKYDSLKTRLITEFSASENEQIRQLISEMHLGNKKPTQLLRKMRKLDSKFITDDFLQTLGFQKLPSAMWTILSISSESLDNLAKMVNKISEVCTLTDNGIFGIDQAAAVYAKSTQNVSPLNEVSALQKVIAALCKQVERLSFDRSRGLKHCNGSKHQFFMQTLP